MQNINRDPMGVPVYLKTDANEPFPDDKLFYLMTRDGLFICRNHPWFTSCAPANKGPSGLAPQQAQLIVKYPKVPRVLMERAVGFFHAVHQKHDGAEAAVILVFNRETQAVELVCPPQEVSWGSVEYQIPVLPPHLLLIGDFHSQGTMSSQPSMTDENDEKNRPGLHLILGRINDEPPEFSCAVVADGCRFDVKDLDCVIEDYRARDPDFPQEWMDLVKKKKCKFESYSGLGNYQPNSNHLDKEFKRKEAQDRENAQKVLARFAKMSQCPTMLDVRQALISSTVIMPILECEAKAEAFVNAWPKMKGHQHETAAK